MTLMAASTQLILVDVSTQTVDEITDADVPGDWSGAHWLADSSAFFSSSDAGAEFRSLRRYDLDSRSWTSAVDREGSDVRAWPSPDGSRLAVVLTSDGADELQVHALDGTTIGDGTAIALPSPGSVAFRTEPVWSPDGTSLAVTFTSPTHPPEVYAVADDALVRRTNSNPAADLGDLIEPYSVAVPTSDGERVPAYVFHPVGIGDPALLGSVVVEVHGGPEAAAVRRWNPVTAALALAGHTVVLPNVRGSDGYGRRWVGLDDGRRRLDSVADLAAVHSYLGELGADTSRAALWGGSYGGYMVLAGLTFQPELWAAGVDIVGMSSLVTFLENTSAYRRAYREREYGTLAEDREFLHAASPLTRIDKIAAPLFVIHGANDPRVPLSEAEQVAAAVRDRGLDHELLVYPGEGHGLAKRANRLDAYPKALAFLARHLAAPQTDQER